MSTHTITHIQQMPVSIEKAWGFFSSAANLQTITPPDLGFTVISTGGDTIYPGQIIEYKLKPLLNIPVYWMTEISHVIPKQLFVDEQRFGPYNFWHHQHHFKSIDGGSGTEMTDIVHYRVPFRMLGDLVNRLVVKKQLGTIFEFRKNKIEALFGVWAS
jgi:ligand-binding SRPBCC domain-containing protein